MFERATSWDGAGLDANAARRAAHEEERVRRGFWDKVRGVASVLPFAEDLLTVYYCAFDRNTPTQVRVALLAALGYFVLPTDAVPDVLPLVGFTDDAAVLAAAIALVSDHITPVHREAARLALKRGLANADPAVPPAGAK
jgi:uncharacterized membrane protein YkvA (DUF1232 family)